MEKDDLVFDVTANDFEERVLRASHHLAVVVDFWAPWCAPCRILGPALEKIVLAYEGKVHLARLNVDENPGLASTWRIQSIPAVKIFKAGKVAHEFIGAQPETEVQRIISSVVPTQADELALEADRLAEDGSLGEAESVYSKVLELEPEHPRASAKLAVLLLKKGDQKEAKILAESVSQDVEEYTEAQSILARIEFAEKCEEKGGRKACEERVAGSPENPDVLYDLAWCLAAEQEYQGALDRFLQVVEIDKEYKEGAAKDAMLRIFSAVGERSELADDYRTRLSMALY